MSVWSEIDRIETHAIPDDVMKAAIAAATTAWPRGSGQPLIVEVAARAIMAERERCIAMVCDNVHDDDDADRTIADIKKGEK